MVVIYYFCFCVCVHACVCVSVCMCACMCVCVCVCVCVWVCVCVCVCVCVSVFSLVVTLTYLCFTACLWLKKENLSGKGISPFEESSFPVYFQVNRSRWECWCMGGRSWWSSLPRALSVLWGNDTDEQQDVLTSALSLTPMRWWWMGNNKMYWLHHPHCHSLLWGDDGGGTRCTDFTTHSVTHFYEVMMDGEQQDVLTSPPTLSLTSMRWWRMGNNKMYWLHHPLCHSLLWGDDGGGTRCTDFTTHSVTHFYEVMMDGEQQDVLTSPPTLSLTSMRWWWMGNNKMYWLHHPLCHSLLWGDDGWGTTRCTDFTTHSVTHFYEVMMDGEQQDVLTAPPTLSLTSLRWWWMGNNKMYWLHHPLCHSLLWGDDGWGTTRCTDCTTHSVTHFFEVMMDGEQQDVLTSPPTLSLTSMRWWWMGNNKMYWLHHPLCHSLLWGDDGWGTTRCTDFTTHSVTHSYEVMMDGEQQDVLTAPPTLSLTSLRWWWMGNNKMYWLHHPLCHSLLWLRWWWMVNKMYWLHFTLFHSLLWGDDGWWMRCTGFTSHSFIHFYEVMVDGEWDVLASHHTLSLLWGDDGWWTRCTDFTTHSVIPMRWWWLVNNKMYWLHHTFCHSYEVMMVGEQEDVLTSPHILSLLWGDDGWWTRCTGFTSHSFTPMRWWWLVNNKMYWLHFTFCHSYEVMMVGEQDVLTSPHILSLLWGDDGWWTTRRTGFTSHSVTPMRWWWMVNKMYWLSHIFCHSYEVMMDGEWDVLAWPKTRQKCKCGRFQCMPSSACFWCLGSSRG